MEYATDLFDSGTIERLAGNFKTLLEGVAADAERPISELPLLSEAERPTVGGVERDGKEYPEDRGRDAFISCLKSRRRGRRTRRRWPSRTSR